jgi:predicted nucleic acid-binding protein
MFVVDASVTLAFCFMDEHADFADAVLGRLVHDAAVAPAIWPFEVANGLRTAERRKRLTSSDVLRVRALLSGLPIAVQPLPLAAATGDVLDAARRFDLTAYDAAYLVLASARGLPLATIDDRLRTACLRAAVELVD